MIKKLFLTFLLGILIGVGSIFIFQKTVWAQNICGDQLTIDLYSCIWWDSIGGCEEYNLTSPRGSNDEACSPTGDDCKTDAAICADVSPKICTPPQPVIAACSSTDFGHCQYLFEQDDCRDGVAYTCVDYIVGGNCNCVEQRYDCWISWNPTATPPPGGGTPTPAPIPSCTLSFNPNPVNVVAGDAANVTANVIPSNGTVDRVDFAIGNSAIATISPNTDNALPYQTVVLGVAPGSTGLTASVYMGGVLRCGGAAPVDPVNVSNAFGWWQVVDADVITNGDIVSPIPATCSSPCDPVFAIEGPGNSPGVPLYAGNYDFSSGVGPGTVSDSPPWGWKTNTSYVSITEYKYAYYNRLIPGDAIRNTIPGSTVGVGLLISQAPQTSPDGYRWVFYEGDLRLNRQDNIGANKIILFVDGNLNVDGPIRLTPGAGFFMAIVSGNITIDPMASVAGPEIEGIFVTDQSFITAVDDDQLTVRGMVAAYGAVDPNRNLVDNTTVPAEVFEYAPDLLFNYPSSLMLKRTRWKEVTP